MHNLEDRFPGAEKINSVLACRICLISKKIFSSEGKQKRRGMFFLKHPGLIIPEKVCSQSFKNPKTELLKNST